MEKAEVYNNGSGWRIAFDFQAMGKRCVLTVEESVELKTILEDALKLIFLKQIKKFEEITGKHGLKLQF